MNEAELLCSWRAGDQSAGETLVRGAWSHVLRFFIAATGGDRSLAEDLTQDTFLTVARRRDRIESSFRAYCYGVARMKRFEFSRRMARAAVTFDEIEFTPDFHQQEDIRLRAKLVLEILRRMGPDEQLLIILKDYLGFTQPELAEVFKIPQSRVAGRLNRARKRFRREFERLESAKEEEWERTLRSLNTVLASIVARLPRTFTISGYSAS